MGYLAAAVVDINLRCPLPACCHATFGLWVQQLLGALLSIWVVLAAEARAVGRVLICTQSLTHPRVYVNNTVLVVL
jgi:hypothetical protein